MKKSITDYLEPKELNPGQNIRLFIEDKYPESTDYVQQIDADMNLDKSLESAVYSSTINYMLRRLIGIAQFVYRIYQSHGDGRVRNELRKQLRDNTHFSENELNIITPWLMECIRNSDDDFDDRVKVSVKNLIKEYNWGCYICGREMDMVKNSNSYLAGTADHKWPRALGGESILENLRYACKDCNNKYKKDFLDYSDFHFEHIIFVSENFTKYKDRSRNRSYEAAIFAKSDYCCVVCQQPAYRVGELSIGRNDPKDSFHFFNLSAYCQTHNPEK